MQPRIQTLPEKKLVGRRLRMSLAGNRTVELWQSFMPERKKISNSTGNDLFCIQVFDDSLDFKNFNPQTQFEKWAAVEVSDFTAVPAGMEPYVLKGGLYAVFDYVGSSADFHKTFNYIFNEWLPASRYELDKREYFEIMGEKYRNNDPASEEEVWIPVKKKI